MNDRAYSVVEEPGNRSNLTSTKFGNKYQYYLAGLLYFGYSFKLLLAYIGNIIGIRSSFSDIVFPVLCIAVILLIVFKVKTIPLNKRNVQVFVGLETFFLFSLIYTVLLNGNILQYDKSEFSIFNYLVLYPFMILFISCLDDMNELYVIFCKCSRLFVIFHLFIFILSYIRQGRGFTGYDMVLGHRLAFCDVFLISSVLNEKRLSDLVFVIPATMVSLIVGSRSVVFVIGSYVFIHIIRAYINDRSNKRLLTIIILGALVLFAITQFDMIVTQLNSILSQYGIKTRNITALLDSTIVSESDAVRGYYRQVCINSWKELPVFGYGILYDRTLLNGTYAHSLIHEIIIDYGFIIGSLVLATALICSIKVLLNDNQNEIGALFFSIAIPVLFVSGSYLVSIEVMSYIGIYLCISNKTKKNRNKILRR